MKKYIKPHLSPELRAQITPHKRRDVKLTAAGIFFLVTSMFLAVNLWPKNTLSTTSNDNAPATFEQKQVLGVATEQQPSSEPQFTQYTVKNGDTLFNISQQYNIRWDSIAQLNNLTEPYVLHAGQILKVPQATTSQVPNKIYTIKENDTLVSIAKQ